MTDAADGVVFNLSGNLSRRFAWTLAGSDDAWLSLDRNNNGTIDDGTELFGNFTPQPTAPTGSEQNGFLALGEYDNAANGGNNDGVITSSDAIFPSLRLWQDVNQNGVSEMSELKTLTALGLASLELDYKTSRHIDENGNQYRYRAKVGDIHGHRVGRWAWDVFLVSVP